MESEDLKKLHATEVEILQEAVRICEDHKLTYFLIGGTLLGAVRHKGFIPWDDDLDIAMPRDDYERFVSICKEELSKQYILHNHITDSRYWLAFAKIRKNGTVFDEQELFHIKTHKGIFIDIFPLDNANKQNSIFQDIQAFISKRISAILLRKRGIGVREPSLKMKIALLLLKPIRMHTLSAVQQKIMKLNKDDNSGYFVNLSSSYNYIKQTIPKEKYFPPVKIEFEGKMYNAPSDYDYILKRIYGDYMQLPPPEKRITHNPVRIELGNDDSGQVAQPWSYDQE